MAKPALDPEVLEALRRNSGLALGSDGVWRYRDAKVAHPRVQTLFHKGLEVRTDGEVLLHVGRLWCYVECESVARFVDGVAFEEARGSFRARFRHGPTAEAGRPPCLVLGRDERLYAWLPNHDVAVLTRAAHQQMVGYIEPVEGDPEGIALRIGDDLWPLPIVNEIPSPGAPRPIELA